MQRSLAKRTAGREPITGGTGCPLVRLRDPTRDIAAKDATSSGRLRTAGARTEHSQARGSTPSAAGHDANRLALFTGQCSCLCVCMSVQHSHLQASIHTCACPCLHEQRCRCELRPAFVEVHAGTDSHAHTDLSLYTCMYRRKCTHTCA